MAITPTLRFADLRAALELYTGTLGFDVARGTVEEGNIAIERGDNRLMLEAGREFYGETYNAAIASRLGSAGAGALYVEAEDLTELYAAVEAAGLRVVDRLADRPWGQTEFTVEDQRGQLALVLEATRVAVTARSPCRGAAPRGRAACNGRGRACARRRR